MGLSEIFDALFLSLKLAGYSTLILLLITTPLAWWLTRCNSYIRVIIDALIVMPMVLPPTVIGFYLLILLSPNSFIGRLWFSFTNQTLVFNFSGLLIGSIIFCLPFVIRPILTAFELIDKRLLMAAATCRASPLDQFFSITLPLALPGIISGCVLGFAHALGEFGIVLMLGGNIPRQTRTASIAIFNNVEQMQYQNAHILSFILIIIAGAMVIILFLFERKLKQR